jgi:hypothetical protein
MIFEHEFRGVDECTFKWHETPCGRPLQDHQSGSKTVPLVVYTEEGRRVIGEAEVGANGFVKARIEDLAFKELIADSVEVGFSMSMAPAYEPRLPQGNLFDQPPQEVLERLRLTINNLDKEHL